MEDADFKPPEAELDEYHPKATRTLFVGNLEKDISSEELRDIFNAYGEILVSYSAEGNRASNRKKIYFSHMCTHKMQQVFDEKVRVND